MRSCRAGRPADSLKTGTTIDRPGAAFVRAVLAPDLAVFAGISGGSLRYSRSIAQAGGGCRLRPTGRPSSMLIGAGNDPAAPHKHPRAHRRRLARAHGRPQGHQLRSGRAREFRHRLRGVFARLLLSRPADHRRQCDGLDRCGHRLLRDEHDDHLRRGVRPQPRLRPLSRLRGVAVRRLPRQHRDGLVPGRAGAYPRLGREGRGDRRLLRRQFLALAFRGVSRAPAARDRRVTRCRAKVMSPMRHDDNLTADLPSFVTHLECAMTGERHEADQVHNLSRAGKPLLVRYDLAGVKKALTKEKLAGRPADIWRYRELLPVRRKEDIVSLGEIMTPIVPMPKLSRKLGGGDILVKDEGRLPTASFKARGLVMAVSMAKALGIKHMAMPTNGNAGAALAA